MQVVKNIYSNLLLERFELPDEYKKISDALFDYTIGLCFKFFKEESNDVDTNIDQLISNGEQYFSVINYSRTTSLSNTHEIQIELAKDKNTINFPIINIIFYMDVYKNSYDISYGEYRWSVYGLKKIKIYIHVPLLIEEFDQAKNELKQTIEHEIRHFLQHTYSPSGKNLSQFSYGVPKKKFSKLKPKPNHATKMKRFFGSSEEFSLIKPVEFKTYIYKYANLIKHFLDLNFDNKSHIEQFKKYFVNNIENDLPEYTSSDLTNISYGTYGFFNRLKMCKTKLQQLKEKDYRRWQKYILEIYKLLFVYAKNVPRRTNEYLVERYAGSKKLRGIWYHGTSTKYLPSILSQGLIPYPKEKSWDADPYASQSTIDRTTYGGIYVTKNLMTAYSAAFRTAQKTKGNRLIVMIDLQSKSLIADEDDIIGYLRPYPELIALWYFKILKHGTEFEEHKRELEKQKEKWAIDVIKSLDVSYNLENPKIRQILKQYLENEGFLATITRTVSYTSDKYNWHRNWDLSKINDEDIPNLPSKQEGETVFRSFVSKLTKLLKSLVNKDSFAPKGRSLQPIRFTGSNKIICIIELIEDKYPTKFILHYGELPQDFINQYKINSPRNPLDLIIN